MEPATKLLKEDIQNIQRKMVILDRAQYVLKLQEHLDEVTSMVKNVQAQLLTGNARMYPSALKFLEVAAAKSNKMMKTPISLQTMDLLSTFKDKFPSDIATELSELDDELTTRQNAMINLATLQLANSVGNANTILARSELDPADAMDWSPEQANLATNTVIGYAGSVDPAMTQQWSADLESFQPFMAPHQGPGF